jgi:hypothetical protein
VAARFGGALPAARAPAAAREPHAEPTVH